MTPIEIVKAFLKAMEKKDYDTAINFVSSDCEYTNLPVGTVHGPKGFRETSVPFFAPIVENEFRLLRTAQQGPFVFVERLDRHRVAHGWFELPVTGVLEVHDGRIKVWR